MSEYTIPGGVTMYELTWGAAGVVEPAQCRLFRHEHQADAAVRFSERVIELDSNPKVWAGWVHLKQCDPGAEPRHMLAWTKTSDERPTVEGLKVDLG